MDINYFDLTVSAVILFLGLKGVINGFFKEAFGLVGIVGGIFVASRFGDLVGQYLSDIVFKFENQSAISFTGFLVTLLVFWLAMIVAGFVFKKLSSMSGLSPIDRALGFVFGASKFFLIASVIAYALTNVNSLTKIVESKTEGSVVFPVLVEVGGVIMKLDKEKLDGKVGTGITDAVAKSTNEITQSIKDELKDSMPEVTQNALDEAHGN